MYDDKIKVVEELDTGGPYDWDIVQLGKDEQGKYWWRADAGCSCNSIYDEEWTPLGDDRTELYNSIDRCGDNRYDVARRAEFRSSVMKELGK